MKLRLIVAVSTLFSASVAYSADDNPSDNNQCIDSNDPIYSSISNTVTFLSSLKRNGPELFDSTGSPTVEKYWMDLGRGVSWTADGANRFQNDLTSYNGSWYGDDPNTSEFDPKFVQINDAVIPLARASGRLLRVLGVDDEVVPEPLWDSLHQLWSGKTIALGRNESSLPGGAFMCGAQNSDTLPVLTNHIGGNLATCYNSEIQPIADSAGNGLYYSGSFDKFKGHDYGKKMYGKKWYNYGVPLARRLTYYRANDYHGTDPRAHSFLSPLLSNYYANPDVLMDSPVPTHGWVAHFPTGQANLGMHAALLLAGGWMDYWDELRYYENGIAVGRTITKLFNFQGDKDNNQLLQKYATFDSVSPVVPISQFYSSLLLLDFNYENYCEDTPIPGQGGCSKEELDAAKSLDPTDPHFPSCLIDAI